MHLLSNIFHFIEWNHMRWLRSTWSALAGLLYLFGFQDINQCWAFLQEWVICYLATCVFLGQNLIRCFLALLHGVGRICIVLCQLPRFDCRTLPYTAFYHNWPVVVWKCSQLRKNMCNCIAQHFLKGQSHLTEYPINICMMSIRIVLMI